MMEKDTVCQQPGDPDEFYVQYASQEVPAEVIKNWFKEAPRISFDDIPGRTELKERLQSLIEVIGMDEVLAQRIDGLFHSYIFCGPPRSGEYDLAAAFMHGLCERYGYSLMELSGGDICCSYVGVAEKTVSTAFTVAAEKAPCLLFVSDAEQLCCDRASAKVEAYSKRMTVEFLKGFAKLRDAGKPIILITVTNFPWEMDRAFWDKSQHIRIPLPGDECRSAFFAKLLQRFGGVTLEDGFTLEEMADETESFNYNDLERIGQSIQRQIVEACYAMCPKPAKDEQLFSILAEGKVKLTRAIFQNAMKECPPSDKTVWRKKYLEFESRE